MKNISLKLHERVFQETERIVIQLNKSRNMYINEAVEFYNNYQKKQLIEAQLIRESKLVAQDSMEVLEEFESLDDEW
jgi:hypothetical protein